MHDEIQIINDGDGFALIGSDSALERFAGANGLVTKDLGLPRLGKVMAASGSAAEAGALVASTSGRWVQLTDKSAKALQSAQAMKGSAPGLSRAIVTKDGKISEILEFTAKGALSNPAALAGAAGLMAQLAMQQTMDEITDYLAAIDKKVDDILQGQKDAAIADMIGAALIIDEAMEIRSTVERVSEVTWSKVQSTPFTIARTQAYALRQIDALAEGLNPEVAIGDLADAARTARIAAHEWLAVIARSFQLQEAIAVLELDRVLESSPEQLEQHRIAVQTSRERRRADIGKHAMRLVAQIDAAAEVANAKVLLHPMSAKEIVTSGNQVGSAVSVFTERLGIAQTRQDVAARKWSSAAGDTKDRAVRKSSEGVAAVKQFGSERLSQARGAGSRLNAKRPEIPLRRRKPKED